MLRGAKTDSIPYCPLLWVPWTRTGAYIFFKKCKVLKMSTKVSTVFPAIPVTLYVLVQIFVHKHAKQCIFTGKAVRSNYRRNSSSGLGTDVPMRI